MTSATRLNMPVPVERQSGTWLARFRDPEGKVLALLDYDKPAGYRPDLSNALNRTH